MVEKGKEEIAGKITGGVTTTNGDANKFTQNRLDLSLQTCEKKLFEISSWLDP